MRRIGSVILTIVIGGILGGLFMVAALGYFEKAPPESLDRQAEQSTGQNIDTLASGSDVLDQKP